jgi:hypothetical protein
MKEIEENRPAQEMQVSSGQESSSEAQGGPNIFIMA